MAAGRPNEPCDDLPSAMALPAGTSTRHLVIADDSVRLEMDISGLEVFLQTKLDDAGCAPGCSAVDESKNLVVARPDAVYFYSTDGRGPCFVHDGARRRVTLGSGRRVRLRVRRQATFGTSVHTRPPPTVQADEHKLTPASVSSTYAVTRHLHSSI